MGITNRGLAWPTLWKLPFQFLNVTQATKWLVGQGLGYHAQTMWRDVRGAFDEVYKKPFQVDFGPDDYLPQKLFVEKDWNRREAYRFYGTATFRDPETGDLFDKDYSVYADTSLTDRELTEIVYAREEEFDEAYKRGREVAYFTSEVRYHKWGAHRSQGYGIAEI